MSVRVQVEPFDPGTLLTAFCAGRETTGAVVSFTGLVRGGADATALELQHYPGFTERRIEARVAAEREVQDALVVHRVGRLAPGEAVVFVATAAAHRRVAFEAADRLMDWLKTSAPFWKREHRTDGAHWIEPTAQDHADAARWSQPA